jgi:carbon monoxide dehydrogenase subunit G
MIAKSQKKNDTGQSLHSSFTNENLKKALRPLIEKKINELSNQLILPSKYGGQQQGKPGNRLIGTGKTGKAPEEFAPKIKRPGNNTPPPKKASNIVFNPELDTLIETILELEDPQLYKRGHHEEFMQKISQIVDAKKRYDAACRRVNVDKMQSTGIIETTGSEGVGSPKGFAFDANAFSSRKPNSHVTESQLREALRPIAEQILAERLNAMGKRNVSESAESIERARRYAQKHKLGDYANQNDDYDMTTEEEMEFDRKFREKEEEWKRKKEELGWNNSFSGIDPVNVGIPDYD